MKFRLWILLTLVLGCGGFQDTTRIEGTGGGMEGTGSDAIVFRVVNDNWASATVRLVGMDGISVKKRLGRVEGLGKETFKLAEWYSGGFRLHVMFLAGANPTWVDPMVYYGSVDCIELMIKVYSPGSYTTLCFRD